MMAGVVDWFTDAFSQGVTVDTDTPVRGVEPSVPIVTVGRVGTLPPRV
jgi:hypothetical protein